MTNFVKAANVYAKQNGYADPDWCRKQIVETYLEGVKEGRRSAKNIINRLVSAVRALNSPNTELTNPDMFLADAEQFIRDIENVGEVD